MTLNCYAQSNQQTNSSAFEIHLKCRDKPLNKVLSELRDLYHVELSFDDQAMSTCSITADQRFQRIEDVIRFVTSSCHFSFKKIGAVYVLKAHKRRSKPSVISTDTTQPFYYFSGRTIDRFNSEPLPYSVISTSKANLITDHLGNYSYKSRDSILNVKISYLGYFKLDTFLCANRNQKLKLAPSVVGLPAVEVRISDQNKHDHQRNMDSVGTTRHSSNLLTTSDSVQNIAARKNSTLSISNEVQPGSIKINHQVANFIPGDNNNTLFNLLRFQPGILASGDQTKDFIIWNSYRGQTEVLFDGITLFNLGGFNDRIGAVNPLMVKDVEIYKGGYNVDYGDRVGGIVNITGKVGDPNELNSELNVNTQTISGRINLPIRKKASLQGAFRYSFGQSLFEINKPYDKERSSQQFREVNLKYAGETRHGNLYGLSFIANGDDYRESKHEQDIFDLSINKRQSQIGFNSYYTKKWKTQGTSTVSFSNTSYNAFNFGFSEFTEENIDINSVLKVEKDKLFTNNGILKSNLKLHHQFNQTRHHHFSAEMGITNYFTEFGSDSIHDEISEKGQNTLILYEYVKDRISISKKLTLVPGLRLNHYAVLNQTSALPRIELNVRPHANWTIKTATGRYQQALANVSVVDKFENNFYYWTLADNQVVPLLDGVHLTSGFAYAKSGTSIIVNGYVKKLDKLMRLELDTANQLNMPNYGNATQIGLDVRFKHQWKQHWFETSYSLGQSMEKFGKDLTFTRSDHDQRHEFKAIAMIYVRPFYISGGYVHGSGFANFEAANNYHEPDFSAQYNRLDLALLYRFHIKNWKAETGLSLLNVLNHPNHRLNLLASLPDRDLFSSGIGFTPSIFLNIRH